MTFVSVSGNLVADPVLRFTAGGMSVVNFGMVENHRQRDKDGQWQDVGRSFYQCTAWGDLADHVKDSFTKGTRVIVTGRMTLSEYMRKDGGKGISAEINAEDVGASVRFTNVIVDQSDKSHEAEPIELEPVSEMAPF